MSYESDIEDEDHIVDDGYQVDESSSSSIASDGGYPDNISSGVGWSQVGIY